MKKRMVGAGGVILVIALVAIGAWYFVHTRSTEAELNRLVVEYKSRTPVTVSFIVAAPPHTPKDQTLYLSGSVPALGNWDAAGVPLKRQDDGKFIAEVPDLLSGLEYEFKVTRGTWGTVETDKDKKELADRTFKAAKDGKVEATVAEWVDDGKAVPGRVTMTPGVRLEKKFKSSALNNERNLIVYLPPDYEKDQSRRYPVLYLQDGQNLMDEATSYQGIEWGIDEAAHRLTAAGAIEPVIVVGVYNTGEFRAGEFTVPFASADKAKAKGDLYGKMMAEEVKPFIDERYRTLKERDKTMIGGGSMGALIAMHTAKSYPNVYGTVVALSPWLRQNDKPIGSELIGDGAWAKNMKFYIDMGTDPGHNYPGGESNALPDAMAFVEALEKAGTTPIYREIEGGKHNESSWSATIEQVLIAVLGKATPATAPAATTNPI